MQGSPRRALKRAVAGVSVGALALTGLAALAASASATQSFSFTRLQGPDRYGTAAVIATQTFPTADTVLIANGEQGHFPDALAGNYLAGKMKAPILLTTPNTLPQYTINALTILKPTKAIILGGTSAVSAAVQSQLSAQGIGSVTRLGGLTRYDTAKLVAEAPGAGGAGSAASQGPTAILANGADFPDALTAGPLAYADSFPVLITDPTVNGLSTQTKQALADLGIKHVLIAGGTAAVTAAAAADLGTGVTSERLAGTTRQLTAVAIANYETSTGGFGNTHVNLARGDAFPDALAGGPHAGTEKAPILLTDNASTLGAASDAYLKAHANTLTDGHVFGGTAAVSAAAVAQATADAKGPANQATPTITNTGGTVAAGQPINFSIASSQPISSVVVSGPCVTTATSSSDTDTTTTGFQGTINANTGATAGSCTLSFAITFSNGTTETDTTTVTITAGAASQTTRPELTSAAITGTVTASQVTPSNPLGTTVAYTFDEPVASAPAPTATDFKLYSFDDNSVPGDTIVGVSGNVVTVRFTTVNTTTNGTPSAPANNVNNYTLATVVQGAATDSQGQTSPDGDAAIGTASSTGGTTATANTTTAPDLRSVGNFRQGSAANLTAVDFTFDQAAFATSTAGYSLITSANTVVPCLGPAQGSTAAGGGTIAGGNGTTTITVTCTDTIAGTPLTAGDFVRATVDQGTVSDTLAHSVAPTTVTNPLEAVHFSGTTTAPDLVSATLIPRNTGTNTSTTQDQVLYTFDKAVSAPVAANFGVFDSSGAEFSATATPTVGGTGNMSVLVTFPTGVDASTNIVGAFVQAAAVNGNQADERGTTPGATSGGTTITPGQVQAPQLTAVALTSATDAFGAVTYTATYTFDKAIGTTAIATPGDFKLFDANGNQLTATTCAAPTGATATNTTVACTVFTDANTSATTPALIQQDVGAATLGTVDAGAVTGLTAPNNNPNPEGAAATTGGTGTPTA